MQSPTLDPRELTDRPVFDRLMQAINEHGDDLDNLAQAFCVIAAETFGDLCSIQVLNQQNEMVHLAGMYDVDARALSLLSDAVVAMADMPRDQGAAAQVIITGQPLFLESVPEDALRAVVVPEFLRYVDEVGMSTAMAVALKGRSGNIGVISLSRHRGGEAYTQAELSLLTEMSVRMSRALDNILLVDSLRAQLAAATARPQKPAEPVARSRLVYDRLMQAVIEHGDNVDRLSQDFCVLVSETIGDLCSLSLLNPHNDMLHMTGIYDTDPRARSLLKDVMAAMPVIPRDQSLGALVTGSGQPVLRKSISEQELRGFVIPEFLPFVEQIGVESALAVPLKGRSGNLLGVIGLYRHKGGKPYDEGDLALLSGIALRMQVALENVLLLDSMRAQLDAVRAGAEDQAGKASAERKTVRNLTDLDRLALLHRLTHMIGANREKVDRMMDLASVMAAEALGGVCTMTLLNRHNELVHINAYYDADPRARKLTGDLVKATRDMPRDVGMIGRVMQTGEPILITSVDEQQLKLQALPELVRYVEEIGVSSILVAPLKGPTAIVGAISLSRHRGDPPFTEADRDFLMEIGFRLAVGVENQQVIESLRREVAASSSTQQALHVSEQRFRSVFESTSLGIELMDATGVVVDVNRAFQSMTGFTRADMLGRPYGTLQHPDDTGPFFRMLTELKMNRDVGRAVENRIVCRDGSVIWVRTNLAAVKRAPEDPTVSFIVAMHENITGRKEAERYFQAVLEATPDALVMVDSQGQIMLVNLQMERMLGYDRHELLGQSVEMLVPERLRDRHPLHRLGYLNEPHPRPMGEDLELFAVAKDGREIPVEISLSPLQMDNGLVVVAAIRDITDRKQRQAALVRSERSLAEAQSVARLGSLEYDLITGALEASDEALRILGMSRIEVTGSDTVLARMHPADRQWVRERTQAVLQSHTPEEFEFRVLLPDGTVRIVHDRVAPYFDPDGKPSRILGTVQDVTEQRLREQEMTELKSHLQSSVELERLRLAQDLHDGPMQELYGASYRLEELRDVADPAVKAALAEVNQDLQGTISELRAMAKELRPPAISNFGLEKAIRSYVEDFQVKHPNINLRLSLAKDHQLLPENMRITLFRVFQQALANVLRHSQASEVEVRFSLDAEEARLVVSDNGAGFQVPPNWMSFVRQGHYGLAGAAERVNALGGILLVESEPRQSTTITAVIPWSRSAGESPGASAYTQ